MTEVVKGGLRVDVGVRAFMPASRSGAREKADMEKLVGQQIECRITKLDTATEDVVVDRRGSGKAERGAKGKPSDCRKARWCTAPYARLPISAHSSTSAASTACCTSPT